MMKSARRRATIGHLSNRHVDWCQPTAQNSLHYRRKVFDKLLDENSSARKLVGRHSSISCHADNSEKQQGGGGAGIIGIVKQQRQQRYCYSSQPNSRKTSENVGNSPRHVPPQPAATLPRLAETLPLEIEPAIGSLRGTVAALCAMRMLQQQNQRRPVTARTGCRLRQNSLQSFPFQLQQKHSQPQLSTIQSGIVMRKMSAEPSFYSHSPSVNHPNNQLRDGAIGNMNVAETGKSHTASSSFSGSSDSVPKSFGQNDDETHEQESKSNIDPVYLALKEATEKYGNKAGQNPRFSQNISCGTTGNGDSTTTPSSCLPRNLSQASLLDSGTFSASGDYGGIGTSSNNASSTGLFVISGGSTSQLEGGLFSSAPNTASSSRSDRIKLTEKMKSFSLDCSEPPSAADHHRQQHGIAGVYPNYRMKQLRSARTHADSFDQCMQRSSSPSAATFFARRLPRRLPSVPDQQQQQYNTTLTVQQSLQNSFVIPSILHIVTHEYVGADCALHPGERMVVVDNGDKDWKHGFKLNHRNEHLFTFPSTCIAAYRTEEEQPMRLVQTCNLMDQKMRLYRDQVVFVQPNSLGEDGRVTVRNEHDKFVKCPLQFLTLA